MWSEIGWAWFRTWIGKLKVTKEGTWLIHQNLLEILPYRRKVELHRRLLKTGGSWSVKSEDLRRGVIEQAVAGSCFSGSLTNKQKKIEEMWANYNNMIISRGFSENNIVFLVHYKINYKFRFLIVTLLNLWIKSRGITIQL